MTLSVDKVKTPVWFYTVPDEAMSIVYMMGRGIAAVSDIIIGKGKVELKPYCVEDEIVVMSITTLEDNDLSLESVRENIKMTCKS